MRPYSILILNILARSEQYLLHQSHGGAPMLLNNKPGDGELVLLDPDQEAHGLHHRLTPLHHLVVTLYTCILPVDLVSYTHSSVYLTCSCMMNYIWFVN